MSKKSRKNRKSIKDLKSVLRDACDSVVPDDLPDGAWYAMHEELVNEFNEREGTDFDVAEVLCDEDG
jgi:hypothetical protein